MTTGINIQDTLKPAFVIRINTKDLIPDSVFDKIDIRAEESADIPQAVRSVPESSPVPVFNEDSVIVSPGNRNNDFALFKSGSYIKTTDLLPINGILFRDEGGNHFSGQDSIAHTGEKQIQGWPLPEKPIHNDWLTIFILLAAVLYMMIRNTARSLIPEAARFFLLRGTRETHGRGSDTLFYRRQIMLNIISYIVLSLFIYCGAAWYGLVPEGLSPAIFIVLAFMIIVAAITLRHVSCFVTGHLSGKSDIFNEYVASIYQSYNFFAIPVFVFTLLVTFTTILNPESYFILALILLFFIYIFRILRFFLIFIKRNISILYLILYLCALEILPVLMLLKYFTGGS